MLFSGTLENIKGYSFIKEKKVLCFKYIFFLNKDQKRISLDGLIGNEEKRKPTNGFICKILDS